MKPKLFFVLLFALMPCAFAAAQDSLSGKSPGNALRSATADLALIYDRNFTARVGSEDVWALHYGVTRVEDLILGKQWFSEDEVKNKIAGIFLRSAKAFLLDLPLDGFSYVFTHEYFGHGMRFRELTSSDVKYHVSVPIYGGKQSWTYTVRAVPLSYQGMIATYEGGIEAQQMLNRKIALHWMATDSIHYRDAALFFFSFLNYYPSTIRSTRDSPIDDPSWYLYMLNAQFGSPARGSRSMSEGAFHSRMALSILNPFIFYSMYCYFKSYLWDASTNTGYPAIQMYKIQYLPTLRSGMTPFGIEYHLENYLRIGNSTSLIDVMVGDPTFYSSWAGLNLSFQNIASVSRCSADLNVALWKQPSILIDGNQVIWSKQNVAFSGEPNQPSAARLGGAISVRGHLQLSDSRYALTAILEFGYKSVGHLDGYNLDASPILIAGMGLLLK